MSRAWRIAVVGTGEIAPRYMEGVQACGSLVLAGCASRSESRTAAMAARFGCPAATIDSLLADPAVDVVLNLTAPADHAALTGAALAAGKHVYSEKPLAGSLAAAAALVEQARNAGLSLACAPATILGPLQQEAGCLLAEGALGTVVGAAATLVYPGPDMWHHNPAALFAAGAGPLFDMGVYDVAALVGLLGPVARVAAFGSTAQPERTIQRGPQAGASFAVGVPTHVCALLQFLGGPIATLTASFDGFGSAAPGLELHGTTGALRLERSGLFAGSMALSRSFGTWGDHAPRLQGWADDLWIIGLLDMLAALEDGAAPRCSAPFALHVLSVLDAIGRSADGAGTAEIGNPAQPPPPLPPGAYHALRTRFAGVGKAA